MPNVTCNRSAIAIKVREAIELQTETDMAGLLDSVNQRTQLVGQNRLELLLFKLMGRQR